MILDTKNYFQSRNMYLPLLLLICVLTVSASVIENTEKNSLSKRALQKEHELPQIEKWVNAFLGTSNDINYQLASLVKLLQTVTNQINYCTIMVLYDSSAEAIDKIILEKLFKGLKLSYVHGRIDENVTITKKLGESTKDKCVSYILFLQDVMKVQEIIGKQQDNKVIIVSKSSQWRIHEFLSSTVTQNFVNLLVICKSEQIRIGEVEIPYILYTHKMYIDGLGASKPQILMSWYKNRLTKPNMPLFPKKMMDGFAGHRFIISVAHQPPFVIKETDEETNSVRWDGLEIRLIKFLAEILNFTTEFYEAKQAEVLGSGDAVAHIMRQGKADIGLAGLYITKDRANDLEMSHGHSQDCAAFVSLTSTALPKYRAIMGPFHWTVWLALTLTYLFAIFPIAFSDRLTLSHLIQRPEEMENMFWYVFGTFTNCFTFAGKNSWSNTEKTSTRMFIGWYWVFTIIISACYTGSIIAFVTLPVLPTTTDTVQQLISGHFQTGTLNKGGWQYWFENSTDEKFNRLLKNIEYLSDVQSGLKNITRAFFWPYAFLGSRDELDFIIRTNYTTGKKKAILHISNECFAPFAVSIAFPKNSVYKSSLNTAVLRCYQSGLTIKMKNDVDWDIMRSATGKLLQANSNGKVREAAPDDRALTLEDTQGMFLLLAFGFVMGGASLISEWLGGCYKFCKTGKRMRKNSLSTQPRSAPVPTPNEKSSAEIILPTESAKSTRLGNVTVHPLENEDQENSVIIHNHFETADNYPDDINDHSNHSSSSLTDESSELDDEISKMFNFDYLFGEDNSVITDSSSHHSEAFGELISDYRNESTTDNCNGNII